MGISNCTHRCIQVIGLGLVMHLVTQTLHGAEIDFQSDVAPILEQRCLACHSDNLAKGELSLTTVAPLEANGWIVPGDAEGSYLVEVISRIDGEPPQMPQDQPPLTEEEVALIRAWINQGAEWPDGLMLRESSKADEGWWSLQPIARESLTQTQGSVHSVERPPSPRSTPLPKNRDAVAASRVLDHFVERQLREEGLHRNPSADRRTLIRRATFDLLGLPPTPQEVQDFVSDTDPHAYENLIDRLLASPHYGERWGRHWLDVIRFGESVGFERNIIIDDLWPLRDYVINSLNSDRPMSEVIREHLAGDLLTERGFPAQVASSFLVAGPYDNVGNQDAAQAAQIRANTIDEMIRATSDAFLGLTVGCARCHDHKFDPIRQADYYSLYATFSGIQHGRMSVATPQQRAEFVAKRQPLLAAQKQWNQTKAQVLKAALERGRSQLDQYQKRWIDSPVDREGTEEIFAPVRARWIRLVSEGNDTNPANTRSFGIDEFEVWSSGAEPRNVAAATAGASASGPSRTIEDFPGAYGPQLAIDGQYGRRFLATAGHLTIKLAQPEVIDRVYFSSARFEPKPSHGKFAFVAEYRIEVSSNGDDWTVVANSYHRQPVNDRHRDHRLQRLEQSPRDARKLRRANRKLAKVNEQLAAIPPLPQAWVGTRSEEAAKGPFHLFLGGSPQRRGSQVAIDSLESLDAVEGLSGYTVPTDQPEGQRRLALANWITSPENPLTPRVLANRVWQHHFGAGIVNTPNDFGFMGSQPSHPELLDWLAWQLIQHEWRLKPMHRLIMLSQTYRQASDFRPDAARQDAEARLLWRFPPRRLSAEEIRDSILSISGQLRRQATAEQQASPLTNVTSKEFPLVPYGGPGFRLYSYLQDNVATYVPLDQHDASTFRRAVYHQNARASVTDLMTEFDQPDCAYSAPRRAETTTPLQALTMLNHRFVLDMANSLADRVAREAGSDRDEQIQRAYQLCFGRAAEAEEVAWCLDLSEQYGVRAVCRALFNTSELIHVR